MKISIIARTVPAILAAGAVWMFVQKDTSSGVFLAALAVVSLVLIALVRKL